jgi:L-amino acid N-acyltransferase YncA
VIVASDYRQRRLGSALVGALVDAARARGVQKVVAKTPAPQTQARHVLERFGFRVDATLPGHALDADGNVHDLVIMSCPLDEVSRVLREFCRDDDWLDG